MPYRLSTYDYGAGAYTPVTGSSLLDGLVAWYNLDEASGTRQDAGANNLDLTDVNTVGSTTGPGIMVNAAAFVSANSEELTHIDAPLYDRSGPYTVAAWVRFTTFPAGTIGIVSKWTNAGSNNLFTLESVLSGTQKIRMRHQQSAGGTVSALTATVATATWYFACGGYDGTDVFISLNNAARVTTAATVPAADTGLFVIGRLGQVASTFFNGDVAGAGFWNRALTVAEQGVLYNGGSGLQYPF